MRKSILIAFSILFLSSQMTSVYAGKGEDKKLSLEFRMAQEQKGKKMDSMALEHSGEKNARSFYVSKKSLLSIEDIEDMKVYYNQYGQNPSILILLNDSGKKKVSEALKASVQENQKAQTNGGVGVVIDGKLRAVTTLTLINEKGRIQIGNALPPADLYSVLSRFYKNKEKK